MILAFLAFFGAGDLYVFHALTKRARADAQSAASTEGCTVVVNFEIAGFIGEVVEVTIEAKTYTEEKT